MLILIITIVISIQIQLLSSLNVKAKKDKIKEFEEWLSGISKEVSRQDVSMDIDIIRPSNSSRSNLNTS